MRAWIILLVAIVLAGCHGRRGPRVPGSNVGSDGTVPTVGGPWTEGGPAALTGP